MTNLFQAEMIKITQAYVMVNCEIGAESRVLMDLQAINGVKEALMVYGVYDIIAKLEALSVDALKSTILEEIRQIPEIRSTLTMIVIENG